MDGAGVDMGIIRKSTTAPIPGAVSVAMMHT